MRILIVNEYRVMSGAEVMVRDLMQYLADTGNEVKLIVYDDLHGDVAGNFTRVVNEFKPDIVHFHNITRTGLQPIEICKRSGIPCILTLHDYYIVCRNRMYYRWDLKKECTANNWDSCGACKNNVIGLPHPGEILNVLKDVPIVCISKHQEAIIRRFGYTNTRVIYNGIKL